MKEERGENGKGGRRREERRKEEGFCKERRGQGRVEGSCRLASMYTQQGEKGANQDAMTLWKDFAGEKGTVLCCVFDGHGPHGHRVAHRICDLLPAKLHNKYHLMLGEEDDFVKIAGELDDDEEEDNEEDVSSVYPRFFPWKAGLLEAFKEVDDHLRGGADIDCTRSGATAVSIVKQNDHLMIANLGDSRAVLCTRGDSDKLSAVQLTVDLKPNVPSEASRIKRCRGRVFALEEEPEIQRVWLPDQNCPGLAMARAFGDFILKDFGIISTPQISCRRLTDKDEFVVLATDGVWDVMSNQEVVETVASSKKRSEAAKKIVKRAVEEWEIKHPTSRIDDCAVIVLFLKNSSSKHQTKSTEELKRGGKKFEKMVVTHSHVSRFGRLLKTIAGDNKTRRKEH